MTKHFSEQVGKTTDGMANALEQPTQKGGKWYDMTAANVFERNLGGDLRVCVKFGAWGGEAKPEYFYACFINEDLLWRADVGDLGTVAPNSYSIANCRRAGSHQEQPVFIADVQTVYHGQHGVARNALLIWLLRDDPPKGRAADSLYLSTRHRLFEFFAIPTYRELMRVEPALTSSFDQRTDEVVETASKMMNDLSRSNADSEWDFVFEIGLENILRGIVFERTGDAIRCRIANKELVDHGVEIVDTFFGPIQLAFDAAFSKLQVHD